MQTIVHVFHMYEMDVSRGSYRLLSTNSSVIVWEIPIALMILLQPTGVHF